MSGVRVYVSIGSNIEPETNIRSCLEQLTKEFGELTVSRTYRNPPVGFEGADFYNLVVGFRTERTPFELQGRLREIESDHGRQRRGGARFSSRTLDLDLLLYGDRIDGQLKLPHPDILHYAFVLQPLAEIAGDLRHPEQGSRIAALWADYRTARVPTLRVVNL